MSEVFYATQWKSMHTGWRDYQTRVKTKREAVKSYKEFKQRNPATKTRIVKYVITAKICGTPRPRGNK